MVDAKAKTWIGKWTSGQLEYPIALGEALRRIDAAAQHEELPPLELSDLDRALQSFSPKTGRGADCLGPLDIRRLPKCGRQCILDLSCSVREVGHGRGNRYKYVSDCSTRRLARGLLA